MKTTFMTALAGTLALALSGPAAWAEFVPNDVLISDPTSDLPDPEFDTVDNHVVWQDTDDNLWLAKINPETGDIMPDNGKGILLDTNLRGIDQTANGPEWAYGDARPYFAYTRDFQDRYVLAAAFLQPNLSWSTSLLGNSFERARPEGTAASHKGPPRIAYNVETQDVPIQIGYRDLNDADSEVIIEGPGLQDQGGRWIEGEDTVIVLLYGGTFEFGTIDINERNPSFVQATVATDGGNKINASSFYAPEYDEPMFVAMLLRSDFHTIGIFRRSRTIPDRWELFNEFAIPSPEYPLLSSPEAFVSNGKSYIVTVAASAPGAGGFKFQPNGPSEIWIAGIDPDEPFFRRVDDPSIPFPDQPQRSEPEMFTTAEGPVVYYSELLPGPPGQNIRLLRRASTGLGPEWGYDRQDYVGPWSSMHRDNRNSGTTPFPLAETYEEADFEVIPNAQSAPMVMGPEGKLYISMLRKGGGRPTPEFRAIDTRNDNAELFRLSNDDISSGFVTNNALVTEEGYFVLAGEEKMTLFTPEGAAVGDVDIPGVPRGLQFGPDGNILLFTWNGWFQSVDPVTGESSQQNLTPSRTFGDGSSSCFQDDTRSGCAYINAAAVDPKNSMIYVSYTTETGNSQIEAWSYNEATKRVSRQWTTPPIPGQISSPVLSADYSRIYVETATGTLRAMNTRNGRIVWTAFLGYTTDFPKEPVVNDFGYIMPGGSTDAVEVLILRDVGNTFEVSFRDTGLVPLSAAAAGRGNRFVLAARKNGQANLVVVNPYHGVINETPWVSGPTPGRFNGVTIREDGWVFLGGGENTTFKAYRPIWPEF